MKTQMIYELMTNSLKIEASSIGGLIKIVIISLFFVYIFLASLFEFGNNISNFKIGFISGFLGSLFGMVNVIKAKDYSKSVKLIVSNVKLSTFIVLLIFFNIFVLTDQNPIELLSQPFNWKTISLTNWFLFIYIAIFIITNSHSIIKNS
jgi:hypothetical protein